MPIIETLTTILDFDIDDETLEKFDKGLDQVVVGLTAIVAGATAGAVAIFAFTQKVAKANDETAKFAKRIGLDVEALQELGFVAELNGGSIDSMNSSLENVNRIASETARGLGPGVEAFGILGISVTDTEGRIKSADSLILDIADSIQNLGTQAEKAELTQKLGIGGDILLSLTQGSEAIRKQREEAKALGFVISKDAAAASENFVDAQLRVMKIVQGVASAIGTKLIKQMLPMIDAFTEWFKLNRLLLQQGFMQFLDNVIRAIQIVASVLARVVGVVNSLVQAIGGWKVAIGAATAAMLILNASALLMPALILAAGAAIFLLIEDIIKFAEGGDSAIGNLAERFPAIGGAATGLIAIFKKVLAGWNAIFKDGPEALDFTIEKLKEFGDAVVDFVTNPLDSVFKLIDEKFPSLGDSKILGGISNLFSPSPQIPAASGGSINTTNNEGNKSITVNVNGGEPASVKQAIKDALNEDYRTATQNLASSVEF